MAVWGLGLLLLRSRDVAKAEPKTTSENAVETPREDLHAFWSVEVKSSASAPGSLWLVTHIGRRGGLSGVFDIKSGLNIKSALKVFNKKNLGVLIARNKKGIVTGIISDGDLKRINNKSDNINDLIVKKVMKKNPLKVNENILAVEALSIMNSKKITVLCVFKKSHKKITGLIHMHEILNANIS